MTCWTSVVVAVSGSTRGSRLMLAARGQGGKRALMRALGLRSKRVQPVQARAKGSALVVRMEAH